MPTPEHVIRLRERTIGTARGVVGVALTLLYLACGTDVSKGYDADLFPNTPDAGQVDAERIRCGGATCAEGEICCPIQVNDQGACGESCFRGQCPGVVLCIQGPDGGTLPDGSHFVH